MSTYQVITLKAKYVKHPTSAGTLDIETIGFKDGLITMPNGGNIALGSATGSKIGTAVTDKLGFWGVTPVIQQAGAAQAAVGTATQAAMTDSTGGTASATAAVIAAAATYDQNDAIAIKNAIASLIARLAEVRVDVAAVKTFQNAERTALVNTGIIKGAA